MFDKYQSFCLLSQYVRYLEIEIIMIKLEQRFSRRSCASTPTFKKLYRRRERSCTARVTAPSSSILKMTPSR